MQFTCTYDTFSIISVWNDVKVVWRIYRDHIVTPYISYDIYDFTGTSLSARSNCTVHASTVKFFCKKQDKTGTQLLLDDHVPAHGCWLSVLRSLRSVQVRKSFRSTRTMFRIDLLCRHNFGIFDFPTRLLDITRFFRLN